jgi:hypothetical protein
LGTKLVWLPDQPADRPLLLPRSKHLPGDVIFTVGALAMMLFVVQAIWAIFHQPTQNQLEVAEVKEAVNG